MDYFQGDVVELSDNNKTDANSCHCLIISNPESTQFAKAYLGLLVSMAPPSPQESDFGFEFEYRDHKYYVMVDQYEIFDDSSVEKKLCDLDRKTTNTIIASFIKKTLKE